MATTSTATDAVSRTYAQSLYELVNAKSGRAGVEETLGELEEILELTRSNERFREFLASPSLPAATRQVSLDRIFRGRVSELTLKFLQVLNEKGRLRAFAGIVSAFDSMVQSQFGRVEVDVMTAAALSPDEMEGVRRRLGESLKKDVVVHAYVEPAMLGGVKFRIGDQLIDGSVATRLRQLKDQLAGGGSSAMRARIQQIIEG